MKVFFAGICLFFSTLSSSCQQKGEDFESVSADEFATMINGFRHSASGMYVRLPNVRRAYSGQHQYQCAGRQCCFHCPFYATKDKPIALCCRGGEAAMVRKPPLDYEPEGKGTKVYELDKGLYRMERGRKGNGEMVSFDSLFLMTHSTDRASFAERRLAWCWQI